MGNILSSSSPLPKRNLPSQPTKKPTMAANNETPTKRARTAPAPVANPTVTPQINRQLNFDFRSTTPLSPEVLSHLSRKALEMYQLEEEEVDMLSDTELAEREALMEKETQEANKREKARLRLEKTWAGMGIILIREDGSTEVTHATLLWTEKDKLPNAMVVYPTVRGDTKLPNRPVTTVVKEYLKTRKYDTIKDGYNANTSIGTILENTERWAMPATDSEADEVLAKETNYHLFELSTLRCHYWNDVRVGQISELKIHFWRQVAFIDYKTGNLKRICSSQSFSATQGHSIMICNKNLANLINQALSCNPDIPLEEYSESLADTLTGLGREDMIPLCLMDIRYFFRYMNYEGCGYPIGKSRRNKDDPAVTMFSNQINTPLLDSLKHLEKKAVTYGVWSEEFVMPYLNRGGPTLGPQHEKMTNGIFYPQACLLIRLNRNFKLGKEAKWFVTEEEKKKLRNPFLPMDEERGLVKAQWEQAE